MPDPSARDYEWDMACKAYEYLDIKNCLCKNIILVNNFNHVKMKH